MTGRWRAAAPPAHASGARLRRTVAGDRGTDAPITPSPSATGAAACMLNAATRRPDPAPESLIKGPHAGPPMSTVQLSRLESLILEKICGLEYVSRVGYIDEGRGEVTILVIHNDDRKRDAEIVRGIGDGGRAIEDEMPDRMITPLAIHDGPDLPEGIIADSKVIYEREAKQ